MRIEKKILKYSFDAIIEGRKTYELRLADWEINPGDILVLKEWDPVKKEYTGRSLEKTVTYVGKTKGTNHWPPEDIEKYGFQIISFK